MMTLVLGGARSGKSALAERVVRASGLAPVYIATAEAGDDEMRARIARHRADRGGGWRTIEAPRDLPAALATVTPGEAALIDCATLWLSNLMLSGADVRTQTETLFQAMGVCRGPVTVVSNEVGQGIVPENALARRFRDAQGRLNQALAARADTAVVVFAGLPLVLKGALADGVVR